MPSSRLRQVNRLKSQNRRYGRYAFFAGLVLFSGYQAIIVGNYGKYDSTSEAQPQNARKLLGADETQDDWAFLQAMHTDLDAMKFDGRRLLPQAESSFTMNFMDDKVVNEWSMFSIETKAELEGKCNSLCEETCVPVANANCIGDGFDFSKCCLDCEKEYVYVDCSEESNPAYEQIMGVGEKCHGEGFDRDKHPSVNEEEPDLTWPVCLSCNTRLSNVIEQEANSVFDKRAVWGICPCNDYEGYTSIGLRPWWVDPFSDYGFLAYTLGIIYIFLGIAVVCDEYFVPALEVITERLALSDDVAGATLMAAGGSAPELFASMVGTFLSKNSVGFATIVGSAVFNVLFVIGMCAIFSKDVLALTWWPLFRDCTYYSLSLFVLALFFGVNTPDEINNYEAICLFGMYIGYVILMYFNEDLQEFVNNRLGKTKSQVEPSNGSKSYSEKGTEPGSPCSVKNPWVRPAQFRAGILKLMYTQDFDVDNLEVNVVVDISGNLEETFKQIDCDQSGRIDPAELGKLVSKVMGYECSKTHVDTALSMIDTNSDGQIEFVEFKKWYIASEQKILAKTKAAFNAVDTSRDGMIDRNEMMAMLQKVGKQPSEEDVNNAFKEFDQDGNGKISYEEFKNWYRNSMINKEDLEGLEGENDDEGGAMDISIPDTLGGKVFWFLSAPVVLPLYFTVPDVRTEPKQSYILGIPYLAGGENWYIATWTLAILWIGLFSTFMVFWATLFGDRFEIAPEVMGLTFLAAGTSIPDLLTSVIVARQGHGDMAVSSSVGSNIFDVLVGLPVPWMLYTLIKGESVAVGGGGGTLFVSLLILFIMLVVVVSLIAAFKWKMTKGLGVTMFLMYFVFVFQDLARQDTGGSCYYGSQPGI